jgi:hypothetical protein
MIKYIIDCSAAGKGSNFLDKKSSRVIECFSAKITESGCFCFRVIFGGVRC